MRRLSETHGVNDERPDGPLFGFSKYRFSFSIHVFHASAKLLKTSVPDHIPIHQYPKFPKPVQERHQPSVKRTPPKGSQGTQTAAHRRYKIIASPLSYL